MGWYLRELRETAGVTVSAAAKGLDWSMPRFWRYETGQVAVAQTDVEAMCRIYGASEQTTEALKAPARETRARGWWHSYGEALPDWFRVYVGLEAAARRIRKYEPNVVPGLLQTVDYAAEVIATAGP